MPVQGLAVSIQVAAGIGQRAPQVVDLLAQVGTRLGLGRVGPEQKGQVLSRLGCFPVEEEVGQQRLQARGVDAFDWRISVLD